MSEKENFEKYMLYGTDGSISLKKCIENEILIILFSLPLILIERSNPAFLILCICPAVSYLLFIIKFKKRKEIEGVQYILHNGIFSGCISFIFALAGIKLLFYLFNGKKRAIIICVVSGGYVLAGILYTYIIKRLIKVEYDSLKKVNGSISVILCGILGGAIGRTFLSGVGNKRAMEILCILCFFLSYLTLIGIFNIFKFQYLVKHKEIHRD